jgi:hypothetical protein
MSAIPTRGLYVPDVNSQREVGQRMEEREHAPDVAGHGPQQVQLLLGRAAQLHLVLRRRRRRRPLRRPAVTTSPRLASCTPPGRLRRRPACWSRPDGARISFSGTVPGRTCRTVTNSFPVTEQCSAGCDANGGIAGTGLPEQQLVRGRQLRVQLASLGNVRHGPAQHEGRVPGTVHRQQVPERPDERQLDELSREQRRAEPDHHDRRSEAGRHLRERRPRSMPRTSGRWIGSPVGRVRYDHVWSRFPEQPSDRTRSFRPDRLPGRKRRVVPRRHAAHGSAAYDLFG